MGVRFGGRARAGDARALTELPICEYAAVMTAMTSVAHTLVAIICCELVRARTLMRSCPGPLMPSMARETARRVRPKASSPAGTPLPAPALRFSEENWKAVMPAVTSATETYLCAGCRLPLMIMPPISTGTSLHDFASACIGYDTYLSASLDVYIAST